MFNTPLLSHQKDMTIQKFLGPHSLISQRYASIIYAIYSLESCNCIDKLVTWFGMWALQNTLCHPTTHLSYHILSRTLKFFQCTSSHTHNINTKIKYGRCRQLFLSHEPLHISILHSYYHVTLVIALSIHAGSQGQCSQKVKVHRCWHLCDGNSLHGRPGINCWRALTDTSQGVRQDQCVALSPNGRSK